MAIDVLSNYFDEFTKKHYDKIQRGLNLTDDQLKEVINQIIKLNPKPGGERRRGQQGRKLCDPGLFYHQQRRKARTLPQLQKCPRPAHQ